jgi:hypothetical protein
LVILALCIGVETAARQVREGMLGGDNFLHASIVERQFIQSLSDSNANGNGGILSLPKTAFALSQLNLHVQER